MTIVVSRRYSGLATRSHKNEGHAVTDTTHHPDAIGRVMESAARLGDDCSRSVEQPFKLRAVLGDEGE